MEGRLTQTNDGASELINQGGGGPVSVDDIICTRVIDESDGRKQKRGKREQNKSKPLREGTSQGSRIAVISSLNSHRNSSLNCFSASLCLTGPISRLT